MAKLIFARIVSVISVFLVALLVHGCVSVPVSNLPEPEPTAKLRVMVLPISGPRTRGTWAVPEAEYIQRAYMNVARFLRDTGIYEVIWESDVERSVGKRNIFAWEWKQSDWSLARKVGKAVHADYLFVVEREDSGILYYRMYFINLESGRQYFAGSNVARHSDWTRVTEEANAIIRESYREIFREAKADLFETALRRGRLMDRRQTEPVKISEPPVQKPVPESPPAPETVPEIKKPAPVEAAKAAPVKKRRPPKKMPVPKKEPAAAAAKDKAVEDIAPAPQSPAAPAFERKPDQAGKALPDGKARLIVYDFNSAKHMEVVSLILADALREELFNLGSFTLVNRENLKQVVDELKLQQSGLVDEKQAVRIGNWLAANEMITGKLAALGQVYVLSATRTDISTLRALGMGSVKCPVGKEEDLLTGIPEIARKLAGMK